MLFFVGFFVGVAVGALVYHHASEWKAELRRLHRAHAIENAHQVLERVTACVVCEGPHDRKRHALGVFWSDP